MNPLNSLVGSVVYIRYKQIEAFYNGSNSTWMEWINIIGMFIGMIASLGVILVGAFQETNVIVAHLVGAFMSFLGGGFYLCIQVRAGVIQTQFKKKSFVKLKCNSRPSSRSRCFQCLLIKQLPFLELSLVLPSLYYLY